MTTGKAKHKATDKESVTNASGAKDVIELEAEEVVGDGALDNVISSELTKHNVTIAVINSLKEKYKDLRLKDVEDRETYLQIKEARKEFRSVGILIEKICKKGREEAVSIQRKWLSKEKEFSALVMEGQQPLDDDLEKFESNEERKRLEEEKKKEEQFMDRQSKLFRYGAQFVDGKFVLGHIEYGVEDVKTADQEVFDMIILPKYSKVFEQIEAERVRLENERKAEADRIRAEKEKMEKEAEEFKKQKEEFERQKKELEDEQRRIQQQKEESERKARQEKIEVRYQQLRSIGMGYDSGHDAFVFESVNVDNKTEICLLGEDEWDSLFKKVSAAVQVAKSNKIAREAKEQLGKGRKMRVLSLPEIDSFGNRILTTDQYSEMSDQEWSDYYKELEQLSHDIQKQKWEAENQKKEEEEKKQRELELEQAGDKSRFEDIISQLRAVKIHEMKSPQYKAKIKTLESKLNEIFSL